MAGESELFEFLDDLEGQAQHLWHSDREAELADRAQAEYSHVTLASRLMASVGSELELDVRHVGRLSGTLQRVGDGWCVLAASGREWIVVMAHVQGVLGASARSTPEVAWSPVHRLGLGAALRRLADGGEPCVAQLIDGRAHEGTVARIGQDFFELRTPVGAVMLVPVAAVVAVRR